jgi:hypothetical protein
MSLSSPIMANAIAMATAFVESTVNEGSDQQTNGEAATDALDQARCPLTPTGAGANPQ